MANPLEWYAADWGGPSPCYDPDPVLENPLPNQAIYGRVVGIPGAVVWTPIWEPLSSGSSPNIYHSGPLAAGQTPTVAGEGGSPATYSPADTDAVAVINFWDLGILRLMATVDGNQIAGELVMTISSGGGYADLSLAYDAGVAPEPDTFWTAHQNTYEIP